MSDASQLCSDIGARLCTLEETRARTTSCMGDGTGAWCWHRPYCDFGMPGYVWTSSPCHTENGDGYWVSAQGSGSGDRTAHFEKTCAPLTDQWHATCCSSYSGQDEGERRKAEKEAAVAAGTLVRGRYGFCGFGPWAGGFGYPCGIGEGHCRHDGDCLQYLTCAVEAGPKYGLPEGTSACIPGYNENQIAFTPTWIYKRMATRMLFVESGNVPLPPTAIVKVLKVRVPRSCEPLPRDTYAAPVMSAPAPVPALCYAAQRARLYGRVGQLRRGGS
jgi:hypothetical protein